MNAMCFRRHAIMAVGLFVALSPCSGQDRKIANDSRRRLALVIGNASYAEGHLGNPVNDARDIHGLLESLGFKVDDARDTDRKELAKKIDLFVEKLRRGDVVLFYYSGHGAQIGGENYLIPIDFRGNDETELKYASYPMSDVQEAIDRSGADLKILIFDACRDNPFRGLRSRAKGLARMAGGQETFIAFATAPGETASDGPANGHSPFTAALLQELAIPALSLDEVFNRINEIVTGMSDNAQVPWHVSTVSKPFYFTSSHNSLLESRRTTPKKAVDTKKAQKAFDKGQRLAGLKQYEAALRSFTESAHLNPDFAPALTRRGMAELLLGRHEQSIRDLQASIAIDARNAESQAALGIAFNAIGKYQDGIESLRKATQLDANNSMAFSGLGSAYSILGQGQLAVEASTRAISLDPSLQGVYYSRGVAYVEIGDHQHAVEDFSTQISLTGRSPDQWDLYFQFLSLLGRANSYSQLGKQREAIEDLDQGLRLKPNARFIYFFRAMAYGNLGDCDSAIVDYKKMIEHTGSETGFEFPKEFAVMLPAPVLLLSEVTEQLPQLGLGECYAKLNMPNEALAHSNEGVRLRPDYNAYNSRGFVLAQLGKYREAIQDYNHALVLNPDYEVAYANRGIAYDNLGNCTRAIDNFDEAIRLNVKNPWTWNNRANCNIKLGQSRLAISDADSALRLKPDFAEALLNRGVARANLNEYDLAITDYTMAIQLKPNYGLAFSRRAKARRASGDDQGAQDDLKRATDLGYKE